MSKVIDNEAAANLVFYKINFPRESRPVFKGTLESFWNEVFSQLENGVVSHGLCSLFCVVREMVSANLILKNLGTRYPHRKLARPDILRPIVIGGPSTAGMIHRSEIIGEIAEKLLEAAASGGRIDCVGLTGFGGIGKSIIARLATVDPRVMTTFGERIDWLTLGPQRDDDRLTRLLNDRATRLTGTESASQTVEGAAQSFMQARKDRPWLIVIDDVW
ncbi:ATP-binding protein, partial [Frankia sp. CIT1]|uniref:ATP-binding protein n=1 Tax=Frankia sp. CIT1 TaxID=2880974 RepID=UPI001EF48B7F